MRSFLTYRTGILIALLAASAFAAPAHADAMSDELLQDEQAYKAMRAQISADEAAGNTGAEQADQHRYRLAILKLRQDRGIIAGPNEHEKQEKQGHAKP